MTEHYVTLYDSSFLPHGIAQHRSMLRHAGDFHLWIIAMDELTETSITRLGLTNVTVLPLASVENERLRAVRSSRSRGEYCWTLTPFTSSIVFDREPQADRVTYLDADVWFAAPPDSVFAEFDASGRAVMITDHAYANANDQAISSGIYCVQFMPFVRGAGDEVASWWQDRCIEWCYARFEDGKFGDQKYLNDWPQRFPDSVHVLQRSSAMQAPWNATRFDPGEAVIFHFHELRTMTDDRVRLGHYRLPESTLRQIYDPFLVDLSDSLSDLRSIGVSPKPQRPPRGAWAEFKDWLALRGLDRTPPRSPLSMRLPSGRDETARRGRASSVG